MHADVNGSEFVLVINTVDFDKSKGSSFGIGDDVWFKFEPDAVHLFDKETEKNLIQA